MADFTPSHISPPAQWLRRLALAGVLLAFVVVVLGAYVRLSAAGLGCPDWPGCYGHATPIGAHASAAATRIDLGKAWREMIHRYAALTLVLIIVLIAALAIAMRRSRLVPTALPIALFAIVVVQAALGMLTVTWQLTPLIVTLHLLFGMTTLALLWWLALSLRIRPVLIPPEPPRAAQFVLLALVALIVQIALGGWTSSNYAAIACPDLPTCRGSFWPAADFRDAFVLWHPLSVNYEGGVLSDPARIAIHFTHRLGAIVATIALLGAAWAVLKRPTLRYAHGLAGFVVLALALQLTIGASMVLRGFPLALATAHNAGAALTLLAVLALLHRLRTHA
ncbi:MAG TPA: COX15/CtaA family protein [Steroidobacteraceae bacterium]|nr:COX15/CtaA family protein [Steroidobacteraceae bacterium]